MNEYVFKDNNLKVLFKCKAEGILAAQDMATSAGIKNANMLIVGIGGQLILRKGTGHTRVIVKSHVVRVNGKSYLNEAETQAYPAPLITNLSLFAGSLDQALVKYKKLLNTYRYDPDTIILWKDGTGYQTIVKEFDPKV